MQSSRRSPARTLWGVILDTSGKSAALFHHRTIRQTHTWPRNGALFSAILAENSCPQLKLHWLAAASDRLRVAEPRALPCWRRTLERHPPATKRNDPPKSLRLWRIRLRPGCSQGHAVCRTLKRRPTWRRSEPTRSSSGSGKRSGRGRLASSDGGLRDSPCSRYWRSCGVRGSRRRGPRCHK